MRSTGFTLIELSIVLVIIGLIVGGVLVGRDLISAAEVRAQVAQIEKYQAALNTFRGKYGAIPGDILDAEATKFGLSTSYYPANGDGIIRAPYNSTVGESNMFWVHLGEARFIDSTPSIMTLTTQVTGSQIARYLPAAKLGGSSYIYAWSGGPDPCHDSSTCEGFNGTNYFTVDNVTRYCDYNAGCGGGTSIFSGSSLRVSTAEAIDKKLDDGLPQSGGVQALYMGLSNVGEWAGSDYSGTGFHGAAGVPATSAWPASATSCYDNGNVAGPMKYSIATNNGAGANCALSFKFQ